MKILQQQHHQQHLNLLVDIIISSFVYIIINYNPQIINQLSVSIISENVNSNLTLSVPIIVNRSMNLQYSQLHLYSDEQTDDYKFNGVSI